MSRNAKIFYEFGPFRVDSAEQQLWRDGEEISLGPKAFGVLLTLIEHTGQTMLKDDLLKTVWPDAIVEENNLADNVSILRQALGDDAKEPRYIKTVPRRGYRFVAKVTKVQESSADLIVEEHSRARIIFEEDDDLERVAPDVERPVRAISLPGATEVKRVSKATLRVVFAAAVVVVFAGVAVYFWRTWRVRSAPNSVALRSIAVLPFKPLVANERDESLEMGMADTLITRLSTIKQLTVRPTSAIRKYTQLEDEAVRAGRELMVDAVLDGNVQKSGDRVRVSVRLVRVEQGQTVWAEQFDEKFTDIFSLQDAISRRVADMLAVRLSGEEESVLAKRYTQNAEAYRFYLLGRYHWNKRTPDGLNKAVGYFNQAIQADSSYALAYAGLADSYCLLPEFGGAPFREYIVKGKLASLKALEIDNTLGEAHISLAYEKYCAWDWAGIEEEYKRGLALNPNYATGHEWYSEYLVVTGRMDEALKEIRLAQQLDPLSLIVNTRIGMTLYYSRRYGEAIEQLRKALEFDPEFLLTHIFLYACYFEKGMHRESIPHVVKGFLYFYSPEEKVRIEAELNAAYDASGKMGLWRKVLDVMKAAEKRDYNYSYTMAEIYMRLDDKDQAFLWLQKAYDVRHPGLGALKVEPAMDGLRADPRFAEFLRRVNL